MLWVGGLEQNRTMLCLQMGSLPSGARGLFSCNHSASVLSTELFKKSCVLHCELNTMNIPCMCRCEGCFVSTLRILTQHNVGTCNDKLAFTMYAQQQPLVCCLVPYRSSCV